MGLGNWLYGWSESTGVRLLAAGPNDGAFVTSVAFSSTPGCKCILAIGRSDGHLSFMSLYDSLVPRFECARSTSVTCISWRPVCTVRPSTSPHNPGVPVRTEDCLVGDENGTVSYYTVEWPDAWEVARDNWPGRVVPVAQIRVHQQQVCGLAWSPRGDLFATGGNDNLCCLFEVDKVFGGTGGGTGRRRGRPRSLGLEVRWVRGVTGNSSNRDLRHVARHPPNREHEPEPAEEDRPVRILEPGTERHRWEHGAAVKAIAFCPWRDGLVATGGGSNDQCIHFFHTTSGTPLATIAVSAQVTSLVWSTTRREIAATFGYAQPEHPVRIAVFSWPDCRQVAAIP